MASQPVYSDEPEAVRATETPVASKEHESSVEKPVELHDASSADEDEDGFVKDPFVPFDNLPEDEGSILTIRAMVIGAICGGLINASNLYLGLKTGWTFSANIFGTLVGFAACKSMEKAFKNVPILGGNFGPRENAILQTSAVAAGGLSSVFVSAFPALYRLHLLDSPSADYWRMVAMAAVGGYFGYFFATPLRKFFIIYVARELRLIFPTPSAVAVTIRSMHLAVGGALDAKKKMKALSIAFFASFVLRVVSQYAPGILWDWHVFTWFFIWGNFKNAAIHVENWGWLIEWTPAFLGSGMLVGLNVGISFFTGTLLAWGLIGPVLVRTGTAFGTGASDDPKWAEYVQYFSLSGKFSSVDTPSPRYWMLWPGVLTMIVVSMVELACQYKVFVHTWKAAKRESAALISGYLERRGKSNEKWAKRAVAEKSDMAQDFAASSEQVKPWMWGSGLLLTLILGCVVTGLSYKMSVGESILAYVLAIVFSFMAVQCAGATDITPLTAASKASQIVLGGVTKGEGWAIQDAQRLNLIGGGIASMGANQASDLVSDFRTGFLLRVPPITQWIAQGIATVVAVFLAPGMFVLFSKAYPCINDTSINEGKCPFGAPSVAAWQVVAVAMTDPTFPVPRSSGIFAIIFAIFGATMVLIRHFYLVGDRTWVRDYWPNIMVMAMAFTIPQTVYSTATLMGAFVAYIWAKKNKHSFETYGYAIAAGMIAGEGIGGVINAIFEIAEISGPNYYGSNIACPADSC